MRERRGFIQTTCHTETTSKAKKLLVSFKAEDFRFNIVQSCLYDNTLVCLPTGLGKTFIAAVVMYNFYRWYPQVQKSYTQHFSNMFSILTVGFHCQGKVVFMAPTKPLVAQQIQACYKIMGIPQVIAMRFKICFICFTNCILEDKSVASG